MQTRELMDFKKPSIIIAWRLKKGEDKSMPLSLLFSGLGKLGHKGTTPPGVRALVLRPLF
jgi:hypothetical protein